MHIISQSSSFVYSSFLDGKFNTMKFRNLIFYLLVMSRMETGKWAGQGSQVLRNDTVSAVSGGLERSLNFHQGPKVRRHTYPQGCGQRPSGESGLPFSPGSDGVRGLLKQKLNLLRSRDSKHSKCPGYNKKKKKIIHYTKYQENLNLNEIGIKRYQYEMTQILELFDKHFKAAI